MDLEFFSNADGWRRDPIRLPALNADAQVTRLGDRRAGARFCARCAGVLEEAPVVKGMWAYCSIECALRVESDS